MAAEYYDREKLYEEVWKEPMTIVSKRYDVSDVALSKTCKKLKVPKPPVGYWAKVHAGQKPKKTALPRFKDAPRIIIKKSMPFYTPRRKIEEKKDYLVPEAFRMAEELKAKEELPDMKVVIPSDIQRLHPFVRNTRRVFKEERNTGRHQDYNRNTTSGDEVFNLDISKGALQRASIILQALCDAFKMRKFNLVMVEKKEFLQVEIMNQFVSFKLSEITDRREIQSKDSYYYNRYEHVPTGRLKLEIIGSSLFEGQKSWTDGKKQRLEDILNSFIAGMITAAAWSREWQKKWELQKIEWAKKEKIREERDRLERLEKEREKQLESGFQSWVAHQKLAEYITAVESTYMNSQGEPEGDFAKWLEWARNYLEKINPFKEGFPKYDVQDPGKSYSWNSFRN